MSRRNKTSKKAIAAAVKNRVSRAEILTVLAAVGAGMALTATVGAVQMGLNRLYAWLFDAPGLAIFAPPVVSFMIAFFPAFLLACRGCDPLHRRLLGPQPEFFVAQYRSADFPLPPWMVKAIYGVAAPFALIGAMNIPKHALLTDTAILDRRALALHTVVYPYTDIERVTMSYYWVPASRYTSEHVSPNRALYVFFRDGRRWSLVEAELDLGPDQQRYADYIAERAGKAVEFPRAVIAVKAPESGRVPN